MENCGLFVKYLSERSIWTSKQGPVVEKMDNAIHRINHYPTDKYQGNQLRYSVDSDLFGEQPYPSFEQLWQEVQLEELAYFSAIHLCR